MAGDRFMLTPPTVAAAVAEVVAAEQVIPAIPAIPEAQQTTPHLIVFL